VAHVIIENVTKIYPGNVKAVDDISLYVRDGEFIVLVGPSGCGKSTTLRMVAGLEEITDGTIKIGDRVVNDVPPKDRDIAMVFQNYALYPHMTVYKNMAFGLKLRGMNKKDIQERVSWAAGILGIGELLERKPKALSGGQRQRVAVGRAIVRQPAAFLFDEPLSNLDAKLRVETRAELKRLHKRLETTTIYVTHDQEEAMTLGDRVVVMDEGLVMQCDTPLSTYTGPDNRFVAGFLGMPPMNFLDGHLVQDSGIVFEGGGVRVKFTDDVAGRVAGHVGQEVVFGLRPEGVRLNQQPGFGEDPTHRFDVTVTVVEPLGNSMDLYTQTSDAQVMVARVPADANFAALQDKTVTFHLDMTRVHLFEPGPHGANITLAHKPAMTRAASVAPLA
jgi:multiple sugar transport system ATP-binding protein